MRRSQRLIAASVLIALSGALAGCSSSLTNFDPSDLLDFLDTKKKLPGERKPVFPEGVPGLEQGVPKDLYKGAAQERLNQQEAQTAAAAAPEEDGSTAAAPPAPKPKKIVRRRTTAPPPDQPAAQPAQASQQSAAPFPAPLPSGTFAR
jgi:hypothetical protein